ncbi:transposase [Mesorhizobium sp. BHbdii]
MDAAEKVRLVEEAMQPGMSVSYGARRAGISPSQLFAWKRRMLEGGATAVQADDDVVGAARVRELDKGVRDLERSISPPPAQRCGRPRSTRTVRCEDRRGHNRRLPLQPCRADEETPSRKPCDA